MNSRTFPRMNERAAMNVLTTDFDCGGAEGWENLSALRAARADEAGIGSGPQSPVVPPVAATEAVAHQTVRAAPPPRNPAAAGDDFGFFIGLAIACPLGALGWWLIAQALQLGLAQ